MPMERFSLRDRLATIHMGHFPRTGENNWKRESILTIRWWVGIVALSIWRSEPGDVSTVLGCGDTILGGAAIKGSVG